MIFGGNFCAALVEARFLGSVVCFGISVPGADPFLLFKAPLAKTSYNCSLYTFVFSNFYVLNIVFGTAIVFLQKLTSNSVS